MVFTGMKVVRPAFLREEGNQTNQRRHFSATSLQRKAITARRSQQRRVIAAQDPKIN
jgi:hypothetical protein